MSWDLISDRSSTPGGTRMRKECLQWLGDHGYTRFNLAGDGDDIEYTLRTGRMQYAGCRADQLPGLDHARFYKQAGRQGKTVLITQPYFMDEAKLQDWCRRHGLEYERLPVSWYYPDRTVAYLIRYAEEAGPDE